MLSNLHNVMASVLYLPHSPLLSGKHKKKPRWAPVFNFPHAKFQTSSQRGSAAESKKAILDFWLSVPNTRSPGFHLVTLLNLPHTKSVQALPRGWNTLFTMLGVYFQGFNRASARHGIVFRIYFISNAFVQL